MVDQVTSEQTQDQQVEQPTKTEQASETTVEQPVKQVETPASTPTPKAPIEVSLTKKQREVLIRLAGDKKRLQDEFQKLNEKEQDIVSFLLEFKEIDQESVANIAFNQDNTAIIVTLK